MAIRPIIFLVSVYSVFFCLSQHKSVGSDEPLYLTPYLKDGRIEEALRLAQVHYENFVNVTSYSGFINVNETYNSQMFFWYFPAQTSPQNAPLILWIQGGPGMTGLVGLFVEHGPFYYIDGHFEERSVSWNKDYHMIYVDSPVGSGFSHTDEQGYSRDILQVADNLHIFILQFFKLFPDLKNNDFYIAGESYAGKYIPALTHTIHARNQDNKLINLKGIAIGNGFIDPINQISYGDYFYSFGLIDKNDVKQFKALEEKCIDHIKNERWIEAAVTLYTVLCGNYKTHYKSLFYNTTGFQQCTYILSGDEHVNLYDFIDELEKIHFTRSIHVGNSNFSYGEEVADYLLSDLLKSVASYLIECLDHYKVVLYGGQLDIIAPYPLMRNMINKLNFSSSNEWPKAERQIWRVDGKVAGYFKTAGNLTEVMVIAAGHSTAVQQPERTYNIIRRLTSDQFF